MPRCKPRLLSSHYDYNRRKRQVETELTVRQAVSEDMERLDEIIRLSFPRFYRFFAERSLHSEEGRILVGEKLGAVFGFAKLIDFYVEDQKYGCILWLAVHPNYRRQHVASGLVHSGVEELKRDGANFVFASVNRRNKASLATFDGEGFERIGLARLWRLFGWRLVEFYRDVWSVPTEVILMHS